MSILPEGYNYHFQSIEVISEMDINGEMQIVITGRTNVKTVDDTKRFLTDPHVHMPMGYLTSMSMKNSGACSW